MSRNANKYLRSQYGQVQEKIKLAKLSGKPIVFLHTKELEVVKYLLTSGSLIAGASTTRNAAGQLTKSPILFKLPDFTLEDDGISQSAIAGTSLFVLFADETEHAQQRSETLLLNSKLYAFLQLYKGVSIKRDKSDPVVSRNILNSMILVVTAAMPRIPDEIALYSEYIVLEPMHGDELDDFISQTLHKLDPGIELVKSADGFEYLKNTEYLGILSKNLKGLSRPKIEQIFRQIDIVLGGVYFENNKEDVKEKARKEILKIIRIEKEQLIATSTILKLVKDSGGSNKKATGLDNLEEYLKGKGSIIENIDKYKQERRIDAPKGILVSGIPGSGKSLMAKYTADLLHIPLIRMDMGDVQNLYVGESERRMVEALELVNAMSPCVLWIDEIEKSLAGSNGNSNSDVSKRLFGKFLTWMQEKEDKDVCCFVFATANDISRLPSELFRSGRFDAKFYTFMPTAEECGEIFEALIRKQCADYEKEHKSIDKRLFDTDRICKKTFIGYLNSPKICLRGCRDNPEDETTINRENKFFSGADIENVIKRAKERYLLKNYPITRSTFVYRTDEFEECLKQAIDEIRTYGETDLEKIAACFAGMVSNNFSPASKGIKSTRDGEFFDLMPFKGYDEYRKEALYKLENEGAHIGEMEHEYDKCLFRMVRNVLNRDREEIIKSKKQ